MGTSMNTSDGNDQCFSGVSVSKLFGTVSSSFRCEKVKLVSSQEQEVLEKHDGKCETNARPVADCKSNSSDRKRRDARSYREWLKYGARKRSPGKLSDTSAEACKEIREEAIESHSPCSKRQRVDIDSAQKSCPCNAEPGNTSHNASPVQDGKELISEINMGRAEEFSSGILNEESQLEHKIGDRQDTCATCMLGGKLLSCVGKGCKKKFHLSCLVPTLRDYPPGVWHCVWCVKKKKELGVHSVSEIESIWDARDVVSENKAMQHEKQYLVKYRSLAHVHNQWIPERKLLFEAPALITKYNSKNQVISWKTEWTVPHRLLQKRKLSFPTNSDENGFDCIYEWLVKWTGLGYDQATWELDNSSFLTSPEATKLIRDFEILHQKSEKFSSLCEKDKQDKCSISELSQLSFGGSPGEFDRYRSYVDKLLAYWHKCQNAVVCDDQADQERVVKVILFVLSLQVTARRPFLIISKSTALSVWESEFLNVASSANIIVYKGSKDVRSSIRSLEFCNGSNSVMFDVLLSSPDVVAEDLDILKGIKWGAVVIDECQRSSMSRYFEQIKRLIADMRLLLVSSQIKDCSADYRNMLSLLDSRYELDSDHSKIESNTDVYELKDIFARYIAFECKSGPSSFVEYWVPVQLSYLQLEQYCATLLSNSMFLTSSLKSDPAGALREVITSTRKCCDHPYLLDQSLQNVVTKGLSTEEKLDVEINVSGKLQLLDKILMETKARGLRALILFQSIGGSGRDSVGNILDDFICQRFGKHSYVRIDAVGYAPSKKKSFVNTFNNKESGRSFLLLEDRACLPSMKLSAVDVVILFDSDWEPQNDIKALCRISIGSNFEQLKVFRLYSVFTIEEKSLVLAKEGTSVDSNIRTLNRKTCLRLLSWGASNLFDRLDDFHGRSKSVSVSNVSCEKSFLNAVFLELLTQLPCSGASNHSVKYSFITEAPQNAVYDGNASLFGEKEIGSMNHEPSIFSWQKLLEGRHPQWKFVTNLSPRNRKRVNYLDSPPRKSEFGDGVIKKKQIVVNRTHCPIYPKWKFKGKRKTTANRKRKLADISGKDLRCSTVGKKDLNQNNPLLLKLGISKLCEVLQLPENVRSTAVEFLEYIMQQYDVRCESTSTSQAYQISLCWTAAGLLKHKIDQNESLALAKLRLNLDCREEDVNYIYSKLQSVAKTFAQCSTNLKGHKTNEESDETDAVTSERATVSKIINHDSAVTCPSGDSNALEFSGADRSLEADINAIESNSLQCQETVSLLHPVRPSSAESNLAITPTPGIQNDVSSNLHVLCQEAPVPRQASLEVQLDEPSGAPAMNSVTLLPQQPSASIPAESETCERSTSASIPAESETCERSTTTLLRPSNDFLSQLNTSRPVIVTPQPACSNPLLIELTRLQKFREQTSKLYEDMILRLKSERDNKVQEIYRKYDMLLQDAEIAFTQKRQDFDSYWRKVYSNNLLAETLTLNLDEEAAQSPAFDSFVDHLVQQPTVMLDPQNEPSFTGLGAPQPSQMPNHSLTGIAATHSPAATHEAERNQVGIVRAPAPHLRALNPPSMLTPHISPLHGRMPNQRLANNPVTKNLNVSALLGRMSDQDLPQGTLTLPTELFGLHSIVAGDLPVFNSNLSALEVPVNIGNHPSPNRQHHSIPWQNLGFTSDIQNLTGQVVIGSPTVPTSAINVEPVVYQRMTD